MRNRHLGSKVTLAVGTVSALLIFVWPLVISSHGVNQAGLAQGVFIAVLPLILATLLTEFSSGKLDSKSLAVLGVLMALNSVVRLVGAGVAGIETAFFLIVLGGYVFGSSFGFILGSGSLLVSALLGAGVGPWLPFQMMAAGLVGLGAGWLGSMWTAKRFERLVIAVYAVLASFIYGGLMTMWNWPFLAGLGSSVSYTPGAPLVLNLQRFITYELLTGGLIWDLGRAVTTVVLIAIAGKTMLAILRRAASKVDFGKSA
jgi:energy-coupling factor transport system substrate-specific component